MCVYVCILEQNTECTSYYGSSSKKILKSLIWLTLQYIRIHIWINIFGLYFSINWTLGHGTLEMQIQIIQNFISKKDVCIIFLKFSSLSITPYFTKFFFPEENENGWSRWVWPKNLKATVLKQVNVYLFIEQEIIYMVKHFKGRKQYVSENSFSLLLRSDKEPQSSLNRNSSWSLMEWLKQ
jgi:hypothetical protein